MKYLKYEVNTQSSIEIYDDSFSFPQINICNYNPFASAKGKEFVLDAFRAKFGSNMSSWNDVLKLNQYRNKTFDYLDFLKFRDSLKLKAYSLMYNSSRSSGYGYIINELIYGCKFNDYICNKRGENEFQWFYDMTYGDCYKVI